MPETNNSLGSNSGDDSASDDDALRAASGHLGDDGSATQTANQQGTDGSQPNGERKRRRQKKSSQTTSARAAAAESSASSKQSKFIQNVYEMAIAAENQHCLGFSDDGLSLEIRDGSVIGPILSRYFKHNSLSSFVRQLNNYGFKTISSSSLGNSRHVFAHPHFKRDDSSLLETITRKTAICVKKKSKGEIIRELQQKNEEQQNHVQQMEMHHLEMFQRIMGLEAENKQLKVQLESFMRPQHPAHHQQGVLSNRPQREIHQQRRDALEAPVVLPPMPPPVPYNNNPRFVRGLVPPAAVQQQPLAPPPPMFETLGHPFYSGPVGLDMSRLGAASMFPSMSDAMQDRDGMNEAFHLD